VWERNGWLEPYLPEEVAKHYDKDYYDPNGLHVTTRILVSPIGYNTNLVKPEEAPKSFADLLDPKWKGKICKAHPAYSGTIMNSTFQIARDLGWEYLEKLARQNVLQVQSATDTPKKIALGERAIMADGAGYLVIRNKEAGQPVEVVYPEEGTPLATSPSAVFKGSPNPNAARLFQNWMHGREGQQILVDWARQYSPHKQTVEKPGVRKLADVKLMKEDAEGVEKTGEEIKARYAKIFKV
jgi:iron(III) transport system substrate-binding protein